MYPTERNIINLANLNNILITKRPWTIFTIFLFCFGLFIALLWLVLCRLILCLGFSICFCISPLFRLGKWRLKNRYVSNDIQQKLPACKYDYEVFSDTIINIISHTYLFCSFLRWLWIVLIFCRLLRSWVFCIFFLVLKCKSNFITRTISQSYYWYKEYIIHRNNNKSTSKFRGGGLYHRVQCCRVGGYITEFNVAGWGIIS